MTDIPWLDIFLALPNWAGFLILAFVLRGFINQLLAIIQGYVDRDNVVAQTEQDDAADLRSQNHTKP